MVTLSSPRRRLRPLFLRAISLFIIIIIFFFFRLFSNEDIGSYRAIRGVCIEEFWTYSAHAQWYSSSSFATSSFATPPTIWHEAY
jgi:hypothetical protein